MEGGRKGCAGGGWVVWWLGGWAEEGGERGESRGTGVYGVVRASEAAEWEREGRRGGCE